MEAEKSVQTLTTNVRSRIHAWLHKALRNGQSVSLWRLPHATEFNLVVTPEAKKVSEVFIEDAAPGFLIAPYDLSGGVFFLEAVDHIVFQPEAVLHNGRDAEWAEEPRTSKEPLAFYSKPTQAKEAAPSSDFQELVARGIAAIEAGVFEKVVPARSRLVEIPEQLDALEVFLRLARKYPHAFVSLTSSPQTGTWLGASPELLVSIDQHQIFKTVALAGTQRYQPGTDLREISWTQKDIEEQALVSRYIINCFKKIRLREFDEHGPKTVQAGNLLHLKTEFQANMAATNFPQLGSVMLQLLHPTSAVCGMPHAPAQAFLQQHEANPRELFAGYLGPVNMQRESHLYVNLRCMQWMGRTAKLYAGAGVTIDSVPAKEWEETELKMNTLLQALQD